MRRYGVKGVQAIWWNLGLNITKKNRCIEYCEFRVIVYKAIVKIYIILSISKGGRMHPPPPLKETLQPIMN